MGFGQPLSAVLSLGWGSQKKGVAHPKGESDGEADLRDNTADWFYILRTLPHKKDVLMRHCYEVKILTPQPRWKKASISGSFCVF